MSAATPAQPSRQLEQAQSQSQAHILTNDSSPIGHNQPPTEPSPAPGESVRAIIDFKRLVDALNLTMHAFEGHGVRPESDRLLRTAFAVYKSLADEAQPGDAEKLAQVITAPWFERQRHKHLKLMAGLISPDET